MRPFRAPHAAPASCAPSLTPWTARAAWTAAIVGLTIGCAGLSEDLGRAQSAYDAAAYEDAEVWLESVEDDIAQADRAARVRYYYLRGMTAFRVGDRSAARHYLALASIEAGADHAGLRDRWPETLERTLALLRDEVPR